MVSLMSIVAEFRGRIGILIPRIIVLLEDSDSFLCMAGAKALSKLSEQGLSHICSGITSLTSIAAEFRGSIGTSIPTIIALLKHNDCIVRWAGADALSKLSEQGM
jgi:hypothetical protein